MGGTGWHLVRGNTCKETPTGFLNKPPAILQGWKWRETFPSVQKWLEFGTQSSILLSGNLYPMDDNHYDGLKDVCSLWIPFQGCHWFSLQFPGCIWTTRGNHLPSREGISLCSLGCLGWPVPLRLPSHWGHSLVDNSGYFAQYYLLQC